MDIRAPTSPQTGFDLHGNFSRRARRRACTELPITTFDGRKREGISCYLRLSRGRPPPMLLTTTTAIRQIYLPHTDQNFGKRFLNRGAHVEGPFISRDQAGAESGYLGLTGIDWMPARTSRRNQTHHNRAEKRGASTASNFLPVSSLVAVIAWEKMRGCSGERNAKGYPTFRASSSRRRAQRVAGLLNSHWQPRFAATDRGRHRSLR